MKTGRPAAQADSSGKVFLACVFPWIQRLYRGPHHHPPHHFTETMNHTHPNSCPRVAVIKWTHLEIPHNMSHCEA